MKSNKNEKGLVIVVLSVIGILSIFVVVASVFGVKKIMNMVKPSVQVVESTDENLFSEGMEKVEYDEFINVDQAEFTSSGLKINWAESADGAQAVMMSVVCEEPQEIQFRSNLTGSYEKVSDTVYHVMLNLNKNFDKAFFEIVSGDDTVAASNLTYNNKAMPNN